MKKILSWLLVVMLLVSALTGCGGNTEQTTATNPPAQSETTQPTVQAARPSRYQAAESFAGGSGTETDPFQISEAGHLVLLHEMLVKEEEETNFDDTYVAGHFILTADIALNDTSNYENWLTQAPELEWEPIGLGLSLNSFAGVLDGNGHKITGLYIDANGDATESIKDYYGLFAGLNGTVKNLTVEQSFIRVSGTMTNVGTIAGSLQNGTIENCTADTLIELSGIENAGGIAGSGGTVTGCTFSGSITQTDDKFVHIGGICGSGGVIADSVFTGTLAGAGYSGGIVGYGANVVNCVNRGTVSGDTAGGISGRVYAAGTNLEIENPHYVIENCVNEGTVSAATLAGGIIGWMGNDESDISMSVIGCENKGQVLCEGTGAGIIGKLSAERTGLMEIKNCVNHADLFCPEKAAGIVGDILGGVLHQEGNVVFSDCKNLGAIASEGQYAAGIAAYLLIMGDEVDFNLTMNGCSNEGTVQCTGYASGILGFSNVGFNAEAAAGSVKLSDNTKLTLQNCSNSASVTTSSTNSMAGGIVGVLGLGYIPTHILDCTNTGSVCVDFALTQEQMDEMQGTDWPEFYQIAGGIIGRIGDAIKLTTAEGVETSQQNVNAENAIILISGCRSTGSISAPDYSTILNKWGSPLYVNYLGGIVGQCSATSGYAFRVENCTYSGADRGLGSMDYPDIGTK